MRKHVERLNDSSQLAIFWKLFIISSQFSSVAQSCPTLWNLKDYSTTDLPVHHQLPELAQTHVLQVGDAIQPSHHTAILKEVYFESVQFSTLNIKKQIA